MLSRNVLVSSTGEASMASLIFGFIASMGTILVVLMVLLNRYLQPSPPTAVQQQPPPVIGGNAASEHQTGQLPAGPRSTDGSPSSAASRTLATDVEISNGPESTPAPVEDSDNAQMPPTAEAPPIPDNGEIPVAAPAEAENIKQQRVASHHRAPRHHERRHHSARRFNSEAPYGQTDDSFAR